MHQVTLQVDIAWNAMLNYSLRRWRFLNKYLGNEGDHDDQRSTRNDDHDDYDDHDDQRSTRNDDHDDHDDYDDHDDQ